MKQILVKHKVTHEIVKSIDVTEKSEHQIERVLSAMYKIINHEQFYIDDSEYNQCDRGG